MPWWGIPLVLIAPIIGATTGTAAWWCIARLVRIDPW